jgi:hypothetical protein
MRASSVVVSLGLLVGGCAPTPEGMELFMAATYFQTNGTIFKKSPNGRHEIMFMSTTAAALGKEAHESKHFAALDDWLSERNLCKRGYRKLRHYPGQPTMGPDIGVAPEARIASRTVQTAIVCK